MQSTVQEHAEQVDRVSRTSEASAPPVSQPRNLPTQSEAVRVGQSMMRRSWLPKLEEVVTLALGVTEGLLVIRFLLKLLGANPDAAFAAFTYGVTAPLVAPFQGLFLTSASGGYVLEPGTIVALAIYPLVAWLVVRVAWLLSELGRTQ